MEDLWPDFKEIVPEKTPISIIKDHASKLYEKTNYLISAEVEKDDNPGRIHFFDDEGIYKTTSPSFQYSFYLEASALNYRYKLFEIGHDIFLYPIYFFEIDKDIINECFTDKKGAMVINDEEELLGFLKNIFGAKKTLKIIQALRSQAS